MRIHGLLLVLFCLAKHAYSQNFDYLKTYGTKLLEENICGISAEPTGGCVFLMGQRDSGIVNSSNGPDTLLFDTAKYIFKNSNNTAMYLVRLDYNGKVIKTKNIGSFNMVSVHYYYIGNDWNYSKMCTDNSGNIYITGNLSGTQSVGGKTMSSVKGRIFFAKFDKDFNLVWVTQTGNSTSSLPDNIIYSSGHIYFYCSSSELTPIGKNLYPCSSVFNILWSRDRTYIYGELKPSDGSMLWNRCLVITKQYDYFEITGMVYLKKKIYLSGNTNNINIVGKDTFLRGTFIVETDTTGKYQKRFIIQSKRFISNDCLATDGEHLYFGGAFSDSVTWGKQKVVPKYSTGGTFLFQHQELFMASVTSDLQPRWFFHPQILDPSKELYAGDNTHISHLIVSNGLMYFGGILGGSIIAGNDTLLAFRRKNGSTIPRALLFKMDFLGNVLWAASGGGERDSFYSYPETLSAISEQSVYIGGSFHGNIKFGNYTSTSKYNSGRFTQDGWLTKVTDYFITRGKVKAGPYCAGDTIKIPFTKKGIFDTSNYFFAELSDEFGNFETGYRELGRLKSNKDSTIIGFLPMFKVASSKLYRIRVRSTYPKVQSYYFLDSLRLLIYSRDKANPGPPETICYGTSVKLSTYGGTKWTWSPKYRMDDSTKRQPLVWPIKDTTYKIIIADSSGCGKADTAFKKIFVRQELKAILNFKDTVLCQNESLNIPVKFVGGDSSYNWQWFFASQSWYPWNKGELKNKDTLIYNTDAVVGTPEKIALALSDGCSSKPDTAFITISLTNKIEIKPIKDTTLCTGNQLKYKATAKGGVSKQYRYQWKDLVTNSILSTTDSLKFLTKKTLKIQLIVNDGCKALGDTAEFEVKVKAELKAITNLRDTIICAGKSLNYSTSATGGNPKAYKFYWLLNGKQIDTINHLQLTINNSSTLTLITTDNCSLNDTVKKTITVNTSPKADFTWDLTCSRTVTKFTFIGTKPNSPITTIFHWNFNNESPSYLENPSYLFTLSGTKKISLVLTSSNGCTDTIKKDVVIKPQSKADFATNDVCETDSAVFINKSQDATGYLWKFGDGQNSKLQNPKHKFQISSTTTYNVTLVAQVTNGCSDSISKAITINKNPSSDFSYTYNGAKVDLKITKAGNAYQWKFGTTDSAKTTATTYSHTIKSSDQTKVCLTATDISGCSSQTCKNVSVGILKLLKSNGFKLYPNPNNGSFTIEIENPSKDVSIEIFNLLGERVGRVEKVGKVNSLDLNLADGMFWVRVKNGDAVWNQKVFLSK